MEVRSDCLYKCISNSRYTPYLLAKKIGAKAILESASFAKGRERYSILMAEEAFNIISFLKSAVATGASDEHLKVGYPPYIRKNGSLVNKYYQ